MATLNNQRVMFFFVGVPLKKNGSKNSMSWVVIQWLHHLITSGFSWLSSIIIPRGSIMFQPVLCPWRKPFVEKNGFTIWVCVRYPKIISAIPISVGLISRFLGKLTHDPWVIPLSASPRGASVVLPLRPAMGSSCKAQTQNMSKSIQKKTRWWFGTWMFFFHSVGNFIIPTDVHSMIFQRGRSTTNQISVDHTHQAMLSTSPDLMEKTRIFPGIPFPRKRPAPRVALRQGPPTVGAPLLGPDGRALRALPLRLQMSEDRLKESLGHRAAFLEGHLCWINRMI